MHRLTDSSGRVFKNSKASLQTILSTLIRSPYFSYLATLFDSSEIIAAEYSTGLCIGDATTAVNVALTHRLISESSP